MAKPKVILGVHDGHNASACLLVDGKVEYMIQEERILYEKNAWGFPEESIKDALKQTGIQLFDIDRVAFASEDRIPVKKTREQVMRSFDRLHTLKGRARMALIHTALKPLYVKLRDNTNLRKNLLDDCGIKKAPMCVYNHALSHAASAYFGMRKDHTSEELVLTADGAGDKHCSTVFVAQNGKMQRIASTKNANSLGAIYALVTHAMGFVPYEHEYKIMGMAPYADDKYAAQAAEVFHRYLGMNKETLEFERKCFWPTNMQGRNLLKDITKMRFDSVAAGLQKFTEDLLVDWVKACVAKTGIRKIVAAGGVFMNVKANQRILELAEVDQLDVLPSCGDESLSYGAATLAHAEMDDPAKLEPWEGIYFGRDVNDEQTAELLRSRGHQFDVPEDIERDIAELLAAGHPVARCRGRMEFGARALGNRSILCDPRNGDCVRVINQMIKKRDFWMPFAPMMLAERSNEYIENPKGNRSPYMMMSYDSTDKFRDFIAAVHNADLTARAQILEEPHNPAMHRCLKHFEQLTGRGVILNTSFNLHGYPVALGAKEALHVFENSGLQYLALGSYLVSKSPVTRVGNPEAERTNGQVVPTPKLDFGENRINGSYANGQPAV